MRFVALLAVTLAAAPAAAQEAPASQNPALARDLNMCADIAEAQSRLACFDAVLQRFGAAPGGAPTTATAGAPAPVSRSRLNEELSAEARKADFGFFGADVRRRRLAEMSPNEQREFRTRDRLERSASGVITSVHERGDGKLVIALDNGQTWIENGPKTLRRPRPGDAAQIRQDNFGFRLRVDGKAGFIGVRRTA